MRRRNLPELVMHLLALIVVISSAGVPTVNAQVEDTNAAALAEFDFNPKTIDVSAGPQTATITLRITDDLSGFEFGNFLFISPSGQQVLSGGYNAPNRIAGNSLENSDDVGTRFDLRAEVSRNGVVIGSGQLDGVSGGSSGFNNADLRTINLALPPPVFSSIVPWAAIHSNHLAPGVRRSKQLRD